jgi:hypothetical protein
VKAPACAAAALVGLSAGVAGAWDLSVSAPMTLEAVAERLQRTDESALAASLARAGLALPDRVVVTLVHEDDPRAAAVPPWVVALASGEEHVVILPSRVGAYPYDSLQAVFTHEVVHLSLTAAAGGAPLPRWFHEGVAVTVERGWGFDARLRLLLAAAQAPAIADVERLFATGRQLTSEQAYLLAAVLVHEVGRRHGEGWPGAVARRVAGGTSFDVAFERETGVTPETAAALAWASYGQWSQWLRVLGSPSATWGGILVLAAMAFVVVRRRRRRRRLAWDEHDW